METSTKRILVVDDEEAIRALLLAVLRRRGFHVDTARNGAEALERCARCRYSIILLDLMMPVMSGYTFLARLESVPDADRPLVLVLTAGTEPRPLNPSIVAGMIRKPFDVELLVDMLLACASSVPASAQRADCPPAESDQSAVKSD